jgi:hypothetical protein
MKESSDALTVDDRLDSTATRPFLVVTPLGLSRAEELAQALAACRVEVAARQTIRRWSRASSRLYLRSLDPAAVARALRFEQQWRWMYPDDRAERWSLARPDDYVRLVERKAELRLRFRGLPLAGSKPGDPAFALHAFHVPDACDLAAEASRISRYCAAA